MTNHPRRSEGWLAALLLAGLSAACVSDPLRTTSQSGGTGQPTGGGAVGTAPAGGAGGIRFSTALGGTGGASVTGEQTTFTLPMTAYPELELDILFMIKNSPSMAPKQARLATNFPLMMQVLENRPDAMDGVSLPDVHIGVVDSDMGAGNGSLGGNCGRVLGDRGLLWGNDPNNPIASVAANGASPQANGCGLNSGARWIEDIQNPNGFGRIQNYTGDLSDVFSCLAQAVGTGGCGEEHSLQAVRVALNPQQVNCDKNGQNCTDINMENVGFLRPEAELAIIIISDDDDCSVQPSDPDGIFQQVNPGDTTSLRCAARGHVCNGQPIPNYDPTNGYTGQGFTANFADCTAKDSDMTGVNGPLPLIPVSDIIASVNGVKSNPQNQIMVAGIIGWPPDSSLPGVVVSNQYQIGKDSTSQPPQQQNLWDYMPICEIPSITSGDGNIYKAYGGLRHKEFIDAYGVNGTYYSICSSDFTGPMAQLSGGGVGMTPQDCVRYPLLDTDPTTPGVQPECQALLVMGSTQTPLPECLDPNSQLPLDPTNPQTTNVPDTARPCWYLYYDPNPTTGCPNTYMNQRITFLLSTGQIPPAGTSLHMTCLTCPASDPDCSIQDP